MASERAIPHLRDIFGLGGQAFHQPTYDAPPKQPPAYDNQKASKKSGKKSSKKDNYRTLTSGDVKTLERHLSMKKTIRKKIMRDLQQAFVEDPNEFRVESSDPEKLKAELSAEAVTFGEKSQRKAGGRGGDPTFLDMLRGQRDQEPPSAPAPVAPAPPPSPPPPDSDSDHAACEKTSFWRRFTMKNKNKR